MRSAEAKALGEQRRQLRAGQGRLLLLQARSEHAATLRHKRIEELEQGPVADQTNKELSRLRKAQIRWQSDKPEPTANRMTSGSNCRHLKRTETEGVSRSIEPAYQITPAKLQHFQQRYVKSHRNLLRSHTLDRILVRLIDRFE